MFCSILFCFAHFYSILLFLLFRYISSVLNIFYSLLLFRSPFLFYFVYSLMCSILFSSLLYFFCCMLFSFVLHYSFRCSLCYILFFVCSDHILYTQGNQVYFTSYKLGMATWECFSQRSVIYEHCFQSHYMVSLQTPGVKYN